MKLICPHCGGEFRPEEATKERIYHELIELASKFGGSWHLVDEYADCFRRSEFGAMTTKKRVRILKEIYELLNNEQFIYDSKRYRAGRKEFLAAMLEVCNAEKKELKNHNYLYVILKKSAARVSAEGLTAKEESQRELARRSSARSMADKPGGERRAEEGKDIKIKDPGVRHAVKNFLDKIGKEG